MAQHQRRIDRVLAPAYLDGLDRRSLDEVRAMEAECTEIETEVSYVRRLAQARIDLLEAELERRAKGGGTLGGWSNDQEMADALAEILTDDGPRRPPADTRIPDPLAPSMQIEFNRGLEHLVSDATLANLPTVSEDELRATVSQLRELEQEVSSTRHDLHRVMESLERDLAQRLAVGQA
jgi:hypothetical protein